MSGVTKDRHLEILGAAKTTLFAYGGTIRTDAMEGEDRIPLLREMERLIKGTTDCHADTARRNLAKAMRQDRYRRMQERESAEADNWGGYRHGRPQKENENEPV